MWGHRLRRAVLACALLSVAVGGGQAHAQTGTATANAITLRPLSIVKLRDLDFGTLIAGPATGTVTIDPDDDSRSTTGGVGAAGGAPQAAQFYTYGGPSQYVQVTRGPFPTLTRVGGGATMTVDQLTLNGPTFRYLNSAGILDLRVGGRLRVGANQMPGDYAGNFTITVTYF